MNWITEQEVVEIRERAAREEFKEKKTDIYYWYARYLWFFCAAFWLVAAIAARGQQDKQEAGEKFIIFLLFAGYHQLQWKRHCERFVLQLEIRRSEVSVRASE